MKVLLLLLGFVFSFPVFSQSGYPNRQITMLVGFAPGGEGWAAGPKGRVAMFAK